MDVLYPVRCEGDGWSLRYSLRSLDRNGVNLGRVVLAGGPFPRWLSDAAVRVECASPYERKQKNILHAVVTAMSQGAVGACLLSSDDHFTLKPYDLEAFPWFGRLRDGGLMPRREDYMARRIPLTPYRESIAATRALLEAGGLPYDWVSGHVNTHVDAADLDAVERLAAGWRGSEWGYEPSTLFIACARRRDPSVRIVPRRDVKVSDKYSKGALDALAKFGDGLLSCGRMAYSGDFREWLEARFPEPSRFERR